MEKKRKLVQVYAIIIMVVSVVTFIICVSVMVSAMLDRGDPLYSGYSKVDLSSEQAYKMAIMKSSTKDQAFIPDDSEVHQMYEAAKSEHIARIMHQTRKNITVSGLLIFICIILFGSHWWMMKRQSEPRATS